MPMKLILTLAWRNLWRNRKRTLITMSSVLFAVFLAIIFTSMEKGSYERMIDSMVKYSTGYIQIQDVLYDEEPSIDHTMLFDDDIRNLLEKHSDQISFYVPRLQNFALVATENNTSGSMIMGIDPELEIRLNDLTDDMVSGKFLSRDDEGLLVARGLADILGVEPEIRLYCWAGFSGATAAGKYAVQGIIDLKIPELNNNVIYMSLSAAQWFYGADDRITALIIMPENPKRTNQLPKILSEIWTRNGTMYLPGKNCLRICSHLMKFDVAGTHDHDDYPVYCHCIWIVWDHSNDAARTPEGVWFAVFIGMKRQNTGFNLLHGVLYYYYWGNTSGVIGSHSGCYLFSLQPHHP
jgi:putative ABC transport system permease protein